MTTSRSSASTTVARRCGGSTSTSRHPKSSPVAAPWILGFPGSTLPGPLADAIRAGEVAGLILFRDNLGGSWELARALTDEVRRLVPRGRPFVLTMDEEGGLISQLSRLSLPGGGRWGAVPTPRALGRVGEPAAARAVGRLIGRRLRSLGVTVDYAPSLDLDTEPENPVIGSRSFGRDPKQVAELGAAYVRGLADAGVAACCKHYPGHGGTRRDSHRELPHMPAGAMALHARPFRDVLSRAWKTPPWAMSAHVAWREGLPASLDPGLQARLLRWNPRVTRITDALEMRALRSVEWAAQQALRAGNDVLLVGRDWQGGLAAMRKLGDAPTSRRPGRRAWERTVGEWARLSAAGRRAMEPGDDPAAGRLIDGLHRRGVRWSLPPDALPAGPWIWVVPERLSPYADLEGWIPPIAWRDAIGRVEWIPEQADAGFVARLARRLDRETRPVLWVTLFRGSPDAARRAIHRPLLQLANLQAVAHLCDETWPPSVGKGSLPTALTSGPSVEALTALLESLARTDRAWRRDEAGWYFAVDNDSADVMRSGSARTGS